MVTEKTIKEECTNIDYTNDNLQTTFCGSQRSLFEILTGDGGGYGDFRITYFI